MLHLLAVVYLGTGHWSYYFGFPIFVDPYLNTDASTMSPFEHGEVSVLDNGG
jgi:hypothetical protein